jgi:hypothetical protein
MGQCSVLDISEANLRCERCNSQIYNNLAVVNLTCAKASYIEIQDQIKSKALTSRHRVAASWFWPIWHLVKGTGDIVLGPKIQHVLHF